jgi:hypothetical protein
VQHDRTRRVCCLEYIILSDVRFCRVYEGQEPNAGSEPRLEAGAERRLEGVGSTARFG